MHESCTPASMTMSTLALLVELPSDVDSGNCHSSTHPACTGDPDCWDRAGEGDCLDFFAFLCLDQCAFLCHLGEEVLKEFNSTELQWVSGVFSQLSST